MKIKILLIGLLLLAACSSTPEKNYQVTNFKQVSIDLTRLADRKRQQEEYEDALEMYRSAESYALKSNDQQKIGINKLKRSLIHIILNKSEKAETLIREVEQANRIEQLELEQAINFINAKLLLSKGDKAQAFKLISDLENFYQGDEERRAYYRLMRWSSDYQQLDLASVQVMIDMLTSRFNAKTLDNIEILSFAYLENSRWAAGNADLEQGQIIIEQSIDHFSYLELPAQIAKSLKFAADFYARHGLLEKSDYYLAAHQRILSDI
jgi:hypothetical protein